MKKKSTWMTLKASKSIDMIKKCLLISFPRVIAVKVQFWFGVHFAAGERGNYRRCRFVIELQVMSACYKDHVC